jgi:amino acid transporter
VTTGQAFKRAVVGRPKASSELEHTLLPKTIALPVFSSDPLSSNAYATQEILLVLGIAGTAALTNVIPIAVAVAVVLATVVVSYRQTVRAYPSGGGAYIVAHENLGTFPGLLAAGALLVDYVLTVAVSVVAGVDAIVSAADSLEPFKIQLGLGFVVFITVANLRGVRESGTLFAIPTYGFVISVYALLVTGFAKCVGGCPLAESAGTELETGGALTLFLILRAFAAGTTALTGVEAISNGVPAFRYPQSHNAATTLGVMGVMSISMFIGISWLANQTGIVFTEESGRTVVAQIAHAVFGGGAMFYVLQAMTAAILILAANTAYQDFPRLSSILARDEFLPRQFINRGDRLVFSNGVLLLAGLASILIVAFDSNLNRLIQLYLVGVFVSFTLSQFGMVAHWRRLKEPGWKRSLAINLFGGSVTATVFLIVVTTKFLHGAWIVVAAIPIIIYTMHSIHRHYNSLATELDAPERRPIERRPGNQHMVILVSRVDAAAARAVGYVRAARPSSVTAIALDPTSHPAWVRLAPEIKLTTLEPGGAIHERVKRYLRELRSHRSDEDFVTLVIPEVLQRRGLFEIIRRPAIHRLKASFLHEPGIQVLDIPIVKEDIEPGVDWAKEPVRNHVVVLVTRAHNAALQAIEWAATLRPADIRAVTFGLDPEATAQIGDEWLRAAVPVPLEIEDSPYRDIGTSLVEYVRQFNPDGTNRVVTVVIPEFVVRKRRHRLLHGQTALIAKRHLIFERGVVATSVPYLLEK